MRKRIILSVTFLFTTFFVFSQKDAAGEYNGYVKFESAPTPGTITVISTGFAKKRLESSKDAVAAAFYALLFRGVPGSQYDLPMISNENEKKKDPIIITLLDEGYTSFVIENKFIKEEQKTRKGDGIKGKMTTHRITINCDALRRFLEQNAVIPKFGI